MKDNEKICSKCKLPKDREKDFYKSSSNKDGLQDRCKECQKKGNKQYARKARERKKSLKKYPGHSIRKKKESSPPTLTQVPSRDLWHNKDNVVYCRGEAIAMATDPKWAREIVEARNSSTDVTQTVALLKQIKNVLVKDLQQENDRLREELARLQVLKSPKQEIPIKTDGNGNRKRKLNGESIHLLNGVKLKQLLNNEGISQNSLANMIEVNSVTLSSWVTGRYRCKMSMIAKIAELLEVDVAELVLREKQ